MNQLPIIRGVSMRRIQELVADSYGQPLETMRSADRKRKAAWPRQMAMALCREYTGKSLFNIGRHFGGRDHTTVIHACRAVPKRVERDRETAEHWRLLRDVLMSNGPPGVGVDR